MKYVREIPITFENIQDLLDKGYEPKQVFDYVYEPINAIKGVKFNGKLNLLDENNKLISKQWFDNVWKFEEEFCVVLLDNKWNFINTEGELISDQWFDMVQSFSEGLAEVKLNGKWNYIDTKGNAISDTWFDSILSFSDGWGRVKISDGKTNLINRHGQFISEEDFEYIDCMIEGFACFCVNDRYNYIDTKGNVISDTYFKHAEQFVNGYGRVQNDELKYNLLGPDGKLISEVWYDFVYYFDDCFTTVELNKKNNFINKKGELLCDQWFDWASGFYDGLATVELNGKYNCINTEGKLQSIDWLERKEYAPFMRDLKLKKQE